MNFRACVYCSAKKNYFLVWLFGSNVLFVLRHVGNVEYEFHGPATRLSSALFLTYYRLGVFNDTECLRPQIFVLV